MGEGTKIEIENLEVNIGIA